MSSRYLLAGGCCNKMLEWISQIVEFLYLLLLLCVGCSPVLSRELVDGVLGHTGVLGLHRIDHNL